MVVPKLPDDGVRDVRTIREWTSVRDSVPSLGLSPNGESLCTAYSPMIRAES
jgi:hypothetical protein